MTLSLLVARGGLLAAALEFRRQIFEKEQGTPGWDDFDDRAGHLVACEAGNVVAAARIVGPGQRPFSLEQYFDLTIHLPTAANVGEIGRYCVREDWRGISKGTLLHLGMMKLAVSYAKNERLRGLICSVQPNLQSFYRRMHFHPIGQTFDHPFFGHTTVMWLDIESLGISASTGGHPLNSLLDDPRIPPVIL